MALANLSVGLDLKARLIVITSLLYYGLDVSLMPDAAYDRMASEVSAHWHRLSPFRQWQLGSREEIASSGFRVKVTQLAADAAIELLLTRHLPLRTKSSPYLIITRPWRRDRRQGLAYLHTNEFRWRDS